ncbi:MAG: murein biosynthesis integral membrane protein MurJ [Burkholderiales bacterium]
MAATTSGYALRVIVNSALWLTFASIIVRSCGAVREIVFAGVFGVSKATDAFFLALTYATFVPSILGTALTTALVARLANVNAGSSATDGGTASGVAAQICMAGVLTTVATFALAPVVISTLFGLQGAELDHAVTYSRILAPLGLTMVLAASMDAVLNSAKQFFLPGITAAATPLTMILAIALLSRAWGLEAAAWGMMVGGIAEVLILTWAISAQRAVLWNRSGARPSSGTSAAFWKSVLFLGSSAAVAAISPVIDQMFLSRLEPGAITTFNYASKVNSLLIGLFGTAFSVAIYPYLTDLAARRNPTALKQLALKISALVLPVTIVASTVVFLFSFEIVELLFARGNFTQSDTALVAHIQKIFAFQLVFYAAGLVAMRVLNALNAANFVLWIACIGVALNALFDWLFYQSMGAGGIALSSVLTSVLGLANAVIFIKIALASQQTRLA